MITTLNNTRLPSLTAPSPPPRTAPATKKQDTPEPDQLALSAAAKPLDKPKRGIGRHLLTAFTAVTALTALAGPAMAQSPPGTAPLVEQSTPLTTDIDFSQWSDLSVSATDLRKDPDPIELRLGEYDLTTPSDTTKTKVGVRLNSVNDFMPDSWTNYLGGPEHKVPDGSAFDDDGWTAEVQLEANIQKGNSETVIGGRLMMLTQTGSREPFGADYQGLRTDVGEFVIQQNERISLGRETVLDYGIGGGVQAIGNVGGESLQTWFHEVGPMGGRTGPDLQGTYTSDGFRVMPMMTAGAKITHSLNQDFDLKASVQTNIPFGRGLGVAGMRAGIGTDIGPVNLEVGGKLDAAWTDAPEMHFHDVSGVREGLYGRLEYEPGKWGGIYTQIETGGFRNEPILSIGIRIGGGNSSRLSPFQ